MPSFQLDRGRLENWLLESNRAMGIDVLDRATVKDFEFGQPHHRVEINTAEGTRTITARWLVDASGRSGLVRRRLGLTREVAHLANACWWRVKRSVRLDDWVTDPAWKARVPDSNRWHSTNHLMGVGYWVWLIPLGSGSTSFGIVGDAGLHPYDRLNRFDKAIEWLQDSRAAVRAGRRRGSRQRHGRRLPGPASLRARLRARVLERSLAVDG